MATWLTLDEARSQLGVRTQTIYAYVSRGKIGVSPDPAETRRSLYRAADVIALVRRKQRGRKRETLAADALFGGDPSIPTSISTFAKGLLYYRGKEVLALSETLTLEEAACLLWGTDSITRFPARTWQLPAMAAGRSRAFVALANATASGHSTQGRAIDILQQEAASLVGNMATAFGALDAEDMTMHMRLAQGWGQGYAVAQHLRKALILLADHELSSSAFSARVAASTGASLPACLLAGLATLTGPLHGDAPRSVQALFDEVERSGADRVADRYLSLAIPVPGFGHQVYLDGDPRAAALMHALDLSDEIGKFIDKVRSSTGLLPNIDAALAALVACYRLPDDAAFGLFAIARSVGMLAHGMEQLAVGMVVRPRGRYIGPAIE